MGVESSSGGNAAGGQAAGFGGVVGPGGFCVHVLRGCDALVFFVVVVVWGGGGSVVVRVFTFRGGTTPSGSTAFSGLTLLFPPHPSAHSCVWRTSRAKGLSVAPSHSSCNNQQEEEGGWSSSSNNKACN